MEGVSETVCGASCSILEDSWVSAGPYQLAMDLTSLMGQNVIFILLLHLFNLSKCSHMCMNRNGSRTVQLGGLVVSFPRLMRQKGRKTPPKTDKIAGSPSRQCSGGWLSTSYLD